MNRKRILCWSFFVNNLEKCLWLTAYVLSKVTQCKNTHELVLRLCLQWLDFFDICSSHAHFVYFLILVQVAGLCFWGNEREGMLFELYVVAERNRARVVLGRDGKCVLTHLYVCTYQDLWLVVLTSVAWRFSAETFDKYCFLVVC